MNAIIGTCSICAGAVCVPNPHFSTVPPTPTCEQCGATEAKHGPVIDMHPAASWVLVASEALVKPD